MIKAKANISFSDLLLTIPVLCFCCVLVLILFFSCLSVYLFISEFAGILFVFHLLKRDMRQSVRKRLISLLFARYF